MTRNGDIVSCYDLVSKRPIRRPAGQSINKYWKKRVYQKLGGYVCQCCEESRKEFLTIDHINGGGNEHRKQFTSQSNFYKWIVTTTEDISGKLRVLCMNCNWGTRYQTVCPHQLDNRSEVGRQNKEALYEEYNDLYKERDELKVEIKRLKDRRLTILREIETPIPEGHLWVKQVSTLRFDELAGPTGPEATGADVQH